MHTAIKLIYNGRVKLAGNRPFSIVPSFWPINHPSSYLFARENRKKKKLKITLSNRFDCKLRMLFFDFTWSSGSSYSMTLIVSPTSKLSSSASSLTYLYVAFTRYKTPGGKSAVVAPIYVWINTIIIVKLLSFECMNRFEWVANEFISQYCCCNFISNCILCC